MRLPLKFASRAARRTTSWSVFGIAGLTLTATWAAGVVSSPADSGSNTAAIAGGAADAPSTPASRFASVVSAYDNAANDIDRLRINFSGRWGVIPSDDGTNGTDGDGDDTPGNDTDDGTDSNTTVDASNDFEIFQVDLSNTTNFPANTNYYIEVALANTPDGFGALEIAMRVDNESCTSGTIWATPVGTTQVLRAESMDASAVFSSLPGGATYCVGVQPIAMANSTTGTFIRRADSNATPGTMPSFTAIVNQH